MFLLQFNHGHTALALTVTAQPEAFDHPVAAQMFVDRSAQGFTVQDADKQFVVDFYKYALVGMALEWIRRDMKEDPVRMTERLNVLLHGNLERALRRFRTDRSPADLDD